MLRELLKRPVFVLATLGLFVLAGAWWFAWMSPQQRHLSSLHQQVLEGDLLEANLNAQLLQLQRESKELKASGGFPSRFERAIPPAADAAELVTQLYKLSQRSGVTLENITDDTVKAQSPAYSSIPVSISVSGGHNAVVNFVDGLYELPRLLTVQTLSLSGAGALNASSNAQYTATISATAYTTLVQPASTRTGE